MDMGTLIPVFAFLFGLILGSFLNVCIHRMPTGSSIVHPPSSCPCCGASIRFYDNIPLLSYLLLRGRCRSCEASIPLRYPVVELATGLLSLALVLRYGPGVPYALYLAFVCALIVVTFIDLQHQIIPDVISLPGIAAGIAVSLTPWGTVSWVDALIGAAAGGGGLFAVAWGFERLTGKEGMGLGDVKLLAMIGAWMGWRTLPFIILSSSLFGILIGGAALMVSRRGLQARIPFGPFLALGALLMLFFGRGIRHFYYGLFF
ncbi:MAG: prepilin peptidase [Thermodesulfobacteriota bacterium]